MAPPPSKGVPLTGITPGGHQYDRRYLAFFECFNREEFFEAHEVLEDLWRETPGELRDFYQGLIQTAAVLLKLKQNKPAPAKRLAARAVKRLAKYPSSCEGLDVASVIELLDSVQRGDNPWPGGRAVRLELERV